MQKELTHLSLFSGVGGLDIAAHWAGFRTIGFCEWAEYPRSILHKRFPDVPIWEDICALTGADFFEATGLRTVDLISGGFPCQPFSTAGKRAGQDDERYLWPEMLRVIQEIRPTWVVGENVAGLLSMVEPVGAPELVGEDIVLGEGEAVQVYDQRERYLLSGILQDLENLEYNTALYVFPASGVGACHIRERIAVVAHTHGSPRGTRRGESAG